ncbi:hypothetical protein MTF66_32760 [Pseudoalteromonas sp. 2CM39R]|uniref:hypothetical protein n=1 Tax=Pseudoalteromonas sp. 2CM39R TaxID=2929856 RepID=UPI0020BF3C1A|nr:hypothetical protein [Pseudoalteromonas sp. 2CM39R]MCK8129819.1 hypothetical protein [Pseudoalteromonas sp. 2CM39R]
MIIEITKWSTGFRKVSFNKVLRRELKMTIAEAKTTVNEILVGNIVRLPYTKELELEVKKAELSYDLIDD